MTKKDASLTSDLVEALVSMIPLAGPTLGVGAKRLARAVIDERKRRLSIAIDAAMATAGMTDREDFAAAIADSPDTFSLLTRLLNAVGVNGYDDALRAMGQGLGEALVRPHDTAELDLILSAIADLGPNHRAVLELLEDNPGENRLWVLETIVDAEVVPDTIVGLCLSALATRGLVQIGGDAYGTPYRITTLGRLVLEAVRGFKSAEH